MLLLDSTKIQLVKARTGKTSRDLAQAYGCTTPNINYIIRHGRANAKTVGKLARCLGVDPAEIILSEK